MYMISFIKTLQLSEHTQGPMNSDQQESTIICAASTIKIANNIYI